MIATVSFRRHPGCDQSSSLDNMAKGRYYGVGGLVPNQQECALHEISGTYADQVKRARHTCKGNAVRDGLRAEKLGYTVRPFDRRTWIADVVEVNTSKAVRCGGPMRDHYLRGVEELGGYPKVAREPQAPSCNLHCRVEWGVFAPTGPREVAPGVTVDGKLVGYIGFLRLGDIALYSMILGHGDHLHAGVMWHLHWTVLRWVYESGETGTRGLKYLMYGGWNQGRGDGLKLWKRKALFEPAYLVEA